MGGASSESLVASRPSAVVGIGASAGGLEALKDFFRAMPSDSGLAFAVIQHLEPAHESQMAEILAKCTEMRVAQAVEGVTVQANCVYTIPSNKYLSIREGRLRLTEPLERHGMRMAIDFFFRSLAEDQQEKAVCIVLSGSGSDGTHGLRAVRSAGGMCMAQEPRTAQFGIMPQSAIDTGLVDYVLPADRMPQVLLAYARHPYVGRENPQESSDADAPDDLASILKLLRARTNTDYRCYKKGTILRRIERRMGLKQIAAMGDYLKLLGKDPQELLQLAKDMQIGVTSFFRDGEAFEELRKVALVPLVAGKSPDSPLRIWVPGCATGEEAYSVAILLLEELALAGKGNTVQVFASDVDETALETARNGIYSPSVATDVSPERLDHFFSRKNDHYQVGKQLRETVVFARQNLIADPPFSKMDLITCRNVLIYLQPEAQQKVFSLFSFALNLGGYLFLGKSEALMDPRGLFETLSKSKRIHRLARLNRQPADLPVFSGSGRAVGVVAEHRGATPAAAELPLLNQQMLLSHFGAAIVLVEPKGTILHFYGQTEKYLSHPKGPASLNVFDMATGTLAMRLRHAIAQALSDNQPVVIQQVPISRKGLLLANVTVAPVPGRAEGEQVLAIILEEAPAPHPAAQPAAEDESAVAQLDAEVRALRGELEATSQEHETANEELRAANEEVMSMNEELQSANEELETSKEELQSMNEELNTVNNQLNEKVNELTDANNDMANLFGATEIATVFLDARLRIKRFTPQATELFNLIPSDIGRPLGHITQNFDGKAISADAAAVMRDLTPVEKEVQTQDNRWYTMRILPYRTLDDRIDGAVVTFADVTRVKRLETYAENIVGTVQEPLLVLDSDLRVVSANRAFYRVFRITAKSTVGELLYELGDGQWDVPDLRKRLASLVSARSELKDFQVERQFPGIGSRIMRLNACRIERQKEDPLLVLLALEDVTEREQARRQMESLAAELDRRVQERTGELVRTVAELENIYNTVPIGLGLLDTELRYVRINERLAAMNGKPVSEHIGRTFRQVVPKIAAVMEAKARQVLDTGQPVLNMEGSGVVATQDNRRAHWLASYIPVKSPDGAVAGVCKVVVDMTEHKRVEGRTHATNTLLAIFTRKTTRQEYMESVVALLQEMVGCRCIGIRIRNERGEIPYEASAGFSEEFLESESRLQIGRDECVCTRVIVGRPLPCDASAMTPAGSFVCNDTRKFLRGLTEKQKSCFRAVCAKNGYASVAVVPVRYQETMLGAIHIADERPGLFPRDIVEFVETISPLIGEAAHRFHVEKERRHNEERYRSLVTATTQIVWTTDAEGRVVDDLPAWRSFTGQSVEDLRNWGWINALHPDDRERTSAIWSAAVKARSLYETEYRVRRADGEYRDFAVRGVPVIEPDGAIREWVGTCTDVTERKRADEQLQVLNEALSQRATQLRALATELTLAEQQERKRLAQVLHDGLQQLLVGMKFSVAAIRSKVKADAGLVKRLEGLDAVVAESIQLSRSLAVELNPPMLSESGLVAAVKWLAEEMKRVHGLTVRVIAGSEVPADAEGVAVLMFQAVRELLFNIVKHAKVKSATVQVSPLTGNQVQVDVVDKGKGFAAASGRKQDVPTGLGLFGIQERIAHMGGRMEVHSAPGQGTRVTLLAEIRPPEATACR